MVSAQQSTTPAIMASLDQPCAFSNLPAELRRRIHELTSSQDSSTMQVDLTDAVKRSPSLAELEDCKAAGKRALELYKTATEAYWGKTIFTIPDIYEAGLLEDLKIIPPETYRSMQHIHIPLQAHDFNAVIELRNDGDGSWAYKVNLLARPKSAEGSRAWIRETKCESRFKSLPIQRRRLQSREGFWIRELVLRTVLIVQEGWAVGSLCRQPESARLCQLLR